MLKKLLLLLPLLFLFPSLPAHPNALTLAGRPPLLPASDIYPSSSWETTRINPFMGRTPELPSTYKIECSPYCSPTGEGAILSSKYGWRAKFGRMHRGVDIALPVGTPIYSSWSGVVRVSGYDPQGFGHYIVIRHDNGLETIYGHLSHRFVTGDTSVGVGSLIALSGNSGRSTGPHLHYEIRFLGSPLNPEKIIDFASGIPIRELFIWNKTMYNTKANRTGCNIKVFRLTEDMTLDDLAHQKDWDIEELCLLNGLLPDMLLKKGRAIRIQ